MYYGFTFGHENIAMYIELLDNHDNFSTVQC